MGMQRIEVRDMGGAVTGKLGVLLRPIENATATVLLDTGEVQAIPAARVTPCQPYAVPFHCMKIVGAWLKRMLAYDPFDINTGAGFFDFHEGSAPVAMNDALTTQIGRAEEWSVSLPAHMSTGHSGLDNNLASLRRSLALTFQTLGREVRDATEKLIEKKDELQVSKEESFNRKLRIEELERDLNQARAQIEEVVKSREAKKKRKKKKKRSFDPLIRAELKKYERKR